MIAETVAALAPHARPLYLTAFGKRADQVLPEYGINTQLRLAYFLANVMHESGALTILVESLNYSTTDRIRRVWPSRFPSAESAAPYVHNPQALAEKVYGGRMGNVKPGDGWKFVGRGLLQITGRESYARFGKLLEIPLVETPELAFDPRYSLAIAAAEFEQSGCLPFADRDDLPSVVHRINGGYVGLSERRDWLTKAKRALHI